MKSIFLNDTNNIDRVYPQDVIQALMKEAGLDPQVVTSQQLLASPQLGRGIEYIFTTWGMPCLSEEEIARTLPDLKAVFYGAGSVQYFARPFLNRDIHVFSAWAANAVPVAEYTVAQIILANKGFFQASMIHERDRAKAHQGLFTGNYNCCVGLIGAGMIGSMVAEKLKQYNMKVLVFDPFLSDEQAVALGVEKVSLEELFSRCQTISNHLANNAQTVGMLNYERCFSRMMPHAVFINTGRGAQVVEPDLIRALKEHPHRTAILDVTFPEPPVEDSELYTQPNVLLTPHIAGSSGLEVQRMAVYMLEEFRHFVGGEPTRWEVSLKMLETMA
ncbi:MAG: hydroxyacid dehydrogenase [Firmicutes bacterium]|nr:hydroxyacid dehydrogenase [Bacillota bacterium]